MSIAVHHWLLQGNVSWQTRAAGRCGAVIFHVLLIKISRSARLPHRCKLLHAFAKISYFTAKNGEASSFSCAFVRRLVPDECIAGTTNVVQVHRFDHRIGEVNSINKSLNVRRTINNGCQIVLRVLRRDVSALEMSRFHGAIKFIIFWYYRLMLFYHIAKYLCGWERVCICVCMCLQPCCFWTVTFIDPKCVKATCRRLLDFDVVYIK